MGKQVAIKGSAIAGTTAGEHAGHVPAHGACALTGSVTAGSPKIKAGGVIVALAGAPTSEADCCDPGTGALGATPHKIRVGGVSVQLVGDDTVPHNGTAKITTGSAKIQSV